MKDFEDTLPTVIDTEVDLERIDLEKHQRIPLVSVTIHSRGGKERFWLHVDTDGYGNPIVSLTGVEKSKDETRALRFKPWKT